MLLGRSKSAAADCVVKKIYVALGLPSIDTRGAAVRQ